MKQEIKRIILVSFFLVLYISVYANMSSPWINGSKTSEAYSSRNIDIVEELIQITAVDFYQAKFVVTYTIKSDRSGKQIPFIFDTMTERYGSNGDFKVWLDDKEIEVSEVPSTYNNPHALQWIDSLDNHLRFSQNDVPDIIGLKYFEADLTVGIHTIRVEYIAEATVHLSSPIKEFSYSYNLKPARYWRSFGSLDIEIDMSVLDVPLEVSLSDSTEVGLIEKWHFTELPQDDFTIRYTPEVGKFARLMIALTPEGLSFIFLLLFVAIHIYLILKYRKKYIEKRFSPVVIIGSILVPLLFCFIFVFSFDIIDSIIGQYASQRHGYTFFIFFVYPVFMPIYWIFMWMADRVIKKRVVRRNL